MQMVSRQLDSSTSNVRAEVLKLHRRPSSPFAFALVNAGLRLFAPLVGQMECNVICQLNFIGELTNPLHMNSYLRSVISHAMREC